MKHLDLPEKTCLIGYDHLPHDWYLNHKGRMVAGKNAMYYNTHYMCPGVETPGRHKGEPDVELDSQTNRPEKILWATPIQKRIDY